MQNNSDEENDNLHYNRLEEDKLIFDLAKERYDFELNRWNVLDNKASSLIGYVTIITGLLIGIGTFDIFEKINSSILLILFFSGLACLLFSIICSLLSVKLKMYPIVPNPSDLEDVFRVKKWKYITIIRQTIVILFESINEIDLQNNKKANWIGLSWYSLVIGLVLLTIFLIVFTFLR